MPSDRLTASQRFKTSLIGAIAAPTISALCRTITWKVEGIHHFDDIIRSGRVPIFAVWHGRILPAIWVFRNRGVVVMASENFDGQWIARIIERLGNRTVSGSTSHGGARALIAGPRRTAGCRVVGSSDRESAVAAPCGSEPFVVDQQLGSDDGAEAVQHGGAGDREAADRGESVRGREGQDRGGAGRERGARPADADVESARYLSGGPGEPPNG